MSFSPKAAFVSGRPLKVDYIPAVAVSAGDVLVVNNSIRIADQDIAASANGSLSVHGGIYDGVKGTYTSFADGDPVFWNATSAVFTTNNADVFGGISIGAWGTTGTHVRFDHMAGRPSTQGPPVTLLVAGTNNAPSTAFSGIYEFPAKIAGTLTLAAPGTQSDGIRVTIINNATYGNVISATGLLQNGSQGYDTATFSAHIGCLFTVQACQGKWFIAENPNTSAALT